MEGVKSASERGARGEGARGSALTGAGRVCGGGRGERAYPTRGRGFSLVWRESPYRLHVSRVSLRSFYARCRSFP